MAEQDPLIGEARAPDLPVHAYPPAIRNAVNETQPRVLESRHLTMIGMYPVAVIQSSKPSFAQLLVVPSVVEYS